jgi:hypothetical protein
MTNLVCNASANVLAVLCTVPMLNVRSPIVPKIRPTALVQRFPFSSFAWQKNQISLTTLSRLELVY